MVIQGKLETCSYINQTHLTTSYSTYPIKFIQQNLTQRYVTVTQVGYGGGLLPCDFIEIVLIINAGSEMCYNTVSSCKVYKSEENSPGTTQLLRSQLKENSLLVIIPDSVVCYDNSKYKQLQYFDMEKDSSLILVDWFTSGRSGRDKFWGATKIHNKISISYNQIPIVLENQILSENDGLSISEKVGNYHVVGSIFIIGHRTQAIRDRLKCLNQRLMFREDRDRVIHNKSPISYTKQSTDLSNLLVSVTTNAIGNGIILRFSGQSVEECYEFLMETLRPVSNLMPQLSPYKDRVCTTKDYSKYINGSGIQFEHPIALLQAFDCTFSK